MDVPGTATYELLPSLSKALPAGKFYVWVQGYTDTKTIGKYQLDLTVN